MPSPSSRPTWPTLLLLLGLSLQIAYSSLIIENSTLTGAREEFYVVVEPFDGHAPFTSPVSGRILVALDEGVPSEVFSYLFIIFEYISQFLL